VSDETSVFSDLTPLVRKAFWEAHNRRCAYDMEPLAWDSLEVDHVLPRSLWDDEREKARVFALLDLRAGFQENDITNLVPCRHRLNAQKGSWIFEKSTARHYRQLAIERAPVVKEWLAQLKAQDRQDTLISNAQAACVANPTLQKKLIEALATTKPFGEEENFSADIFLFSRSRVLIHCHLPRRGRQPSLLININSLYLHAVSFTFESRDLLRTLLRGWGTEPTLGQRGFVIGKDTERNDTWIATLGGATIFLTMEELQQLCLGIDRLAPHVLNAFARLEIADGTYPFQPDGTRNVRLLTMQRALWREMLNFAREHDYEKGRSPWHIFDASGSGHIKIVQRTATGGIVPFNVYLYPVSVDRWGPMTHDETEVAICWYGDLSRLHDRDASDEGTSGWNAQQAFDWLVGKFIPEIIRRVDAPSLLDRLRRFSGVDAPPEYFSQTHGVPDPLLHTPQSWSDLDRFADETQSFYITHCHEPVPAPLIASAFAGLEYLAASIRVPQDKLDYIAIKLGVARGGDLTALVATGRQQLLVHAQFTGSELEHVLRCAIAIFDVRIPTDGSLPDLLAKILAAWEPLVIATRYEIIRQRALERLSQTGSRD
jgi:hypothetical protein